MSNTEKCALVTGANRGIGFETARQLAGRPGRVRRVILTARDEQKGGSAAEAIGKETAGAVEFVRLDVADESSISAAAEELRGRGTGIDILVNNAAITMNGFDERVARGTIDTNFYGPVRVTEALLPLIPSGGTIVMVSSGAGELSIFSNELKERFMDPELTREGLLELVEGFVDAVRRGTHAREGWPSSAYGVSKAALNGYVRVMAPVLAERSIRINAVCPGWVRTDMGGPGAPRAVAEGAGSILWAALLEEDRTGGFYRDGNSIPW